MIRYADSEDAKKAVVLWTGRALSVEHVGNHGNSIFLFKNSDGESQILRFTDPHFRSYDEVLAELHFVNHLHQVGSAWLPVCPPRMDLWPSR